MARSEGILFSSLYNLARDDLLPDPAMLSLSGPLSGYFSGSAVPPPCNQRSPRPEFFLLSRCHPDCAVQPYIFAVKVTILDHQQRERSIFGGITQPLREGNAGGERILHILRRALKQ